jgi:hypothetical protein
VADGTFDERIGALAEQIGFGSVIGSVEVDQVYAHYQHENVALRHPRGGGPFYLTAPLMERWELYMQNMADALLDGRLREAMAENMEDLSREVSERAPIEFGFLRGSGHPTVRDDGVVTYDRPPLYHRLTEAEIYALGGYGR